jgi:xanthine permease XanP
MRKPLNIVYGVDEKPPMGVTLLSGLQHVGLIAIALVYPVIVSREAGLPPKATLDILGVSMFVLGIGTLLQALPRGFVGARLLCPTVFTAAYLTPSLHAVKVGGLSLVFGMTAFGGLIEVGLSRILRPLRPYLPAEISGFVVVMIGVAVGALGVKNLLAIGTPGAVGAWHLMVAAVTLGTMVGLNIWTQGPPRLFCGLIGIAVGYVAAAAAGILTAGDLAVVGTAPLVHVPGTAHLGWAFDLGMAIPFFVAALATCVRNTGDITIAQRINDADWVRPNMRSLSGGVLANGLVNICSGALGTLGASTYTGSIGFAGATGVTSRWVAYAIGGIFLALAFLPKGSAFLIIMPRPVVGAVLLFAACFILVNGLQIITSRLLDARKTFVIGLSFMLGLAVDLYPGFFSALPEGVRPLVSSSLVLGTLSALLLNAIFRLGVRRVGTLHVTPGAYDPGKIEDFMEAHGAAWGARRDVIDRARFNLAQSIETIVEGCDPEGPLTVQASFDEFNLDLRVSYPGAPLELPEVRPSNEEIMASAEGQRKLAGFMLRRYADRVQSVHGNGRSTVLFHFDH